MAVKKDDRPDLVLDDAAGFISFYRNLPQKDSSTIRLFERGDFYSVHGPDAAFVSEAVYRTTTILKYLGKTSNGNGGLASCTLSKTAFRTFLHDALVNRNLRIEIWASDNSRNKSFHLAKQASPGNLQDVEELMLGYRDLNSNPVIIAVKLQVNVEGRLVGVGFANANLRELGVCEFIDNEVFSNLESLVIQLGAKECVLQQDQKKDYDLTKIRETIDRCGIVITEKRAVDFNSRDIAQDLRRLMNGDVNTSVLPQLDLKVASSALAALIRYLNLLSDSTNFGQYQLYQHDLAHFMKLDASAVKALNLMPSPREGANKSMSLFGLLNKCKSSLGTRLLSQWLKQPLMSFSEIQDRHTLVEAFVEHSEVRQIFQEDLLKAKQISGIEDVVRVYQLAIRLPSFVENLEAIIDEKHSDLIKKTYTDPFRGHIVNLDKFQEMVETTIDLEALDNHEFLIKVDFDESLQEIRNRLNDLKSGIEEIHIEVGDVLGMDTTKKLKLEQHMVHNYSLRVTRTDSACLRGKKEYIDLATQKNGVIFTTKKLMSLSKEYEECQRSYKSHQAGLVKEVVEIAASYCPVLEKLAGVIAHLDVIISFAHVSVYAPAPYVRPKMNQRGQEKCVLVEARHPCLEVQDDVSFIPNDVLLERGKSEFLIITGPNMGGKSTYIRLIGVIALMAQVGCFVPCLEAELCIFDCILARVGASDSQLKGVSTFMQEMLETATILKTATSDSLIIIDELGRGTSTTDGFGLAWAISEHIINNIKAFTLFATHFHELTVLANGSPVVKNLHVVAHVGENGESREITLLYKIEEGICDQSFGIHVAEIARFPEKVVKMAKRKANELEDFSGKGMNTRMKCSKEEIEEGSRLMKELLIEWKNSIDLQNMTEEEMLAKFRDVLESDRGKDVMNLAFIKDAIETL
ncbi:DNA mismatch repair protein msh-2 [Neolecta irregularis DAH-3]|uniref:DNA mismatch repair protein msh-2 n=1 Tax=Neolecta irregularis (strain DAH-3) TaxID=1198029 RepID=A0A1U7LJJ2_NEOID|nr:DNA mismatch repair protein msh-2 [Neolecta irregularis DAH-3]|eukprot:OLL22825.1 DNA mismatch repair protein msh-2 [Neolecta irregularis DAH-3]